MREIPPGGIYTIERLTNGKVSSFSRKTNNQFPALPRMAVVRNPQSAPADDFRDRQFALILYLLRTHLRPSHRAKFCLLDK